MQLPNLVERIATSNSPPSFLSWYTLVQCCSHMFFADPARNVIFRDARTRHMKRRAFLSSAATIGAATLLLPRALGNTVQRLSPDRADALLRALVDEAVRAGATYADARFTSSRQQSMQVRKDVPYSALDSRSQGIAIRVYKDGNWGFAASADAETADPRALAATACLLASEAGALATVPFSREGRLTGKAVTWSAPFEIDPFSLPVKEKADFLISLLQPAAKNSKVAYTVANLFQMKRETRFFSSLDASVTQTFMTVYPNFAVTAFDGSRRRIDSRSGSTEPAAGGYELLSKHPFDTEIWKTADEAMEMQQAAALTAGDYDLILDPSFFWRILYDTLLPHLDPVVIHGMSGDVPSTPLVPPAGIGSAVVASDLLSLSFDNTLARGLASCGWDDAGRPSSAGTLVKNGIVTGLPYSEEFAASGASSAGSTRAPGWSSAPRFAMPNIVATPAEGGKSLEEMIANTERGILFSGKGQTQHTVNRRWFRASPQAAWLVVNGKRAGMVRDFAIDSALHYFWTMLSEIGGPQDLRSGGDLFPQAANPAWDMPFSVAVPPARFSRIALVSTLEERK
jgi:TldD protein